MYFIKNISVFDNTLITFRADIYLIQWILIDFRMILMLSFSLSPVSVFFQRLDVSLHDVMVGFVHPAIHEVILLHLRQIHETVAVAVMFHPHILVMR